MTDIHKQREMAKKKRVEILATEVRELERKIMDMEREIEEARR